MKKITAFFAILAVMICSVTYIAFGSNETEIKQWNGISKLNENTIYEVNSEITLSISRVLPQNSAIIIRKGGILTVENGGYLYISGSIIVENGGMLRSKNYIRFSKSSKAEINGDLSVRENAKLIVNGSLISGESSKLYNYGSITCGSESNSEINGKLYNKGNAVITLSGAVSVKGTSVNSGAITAAKSSSLTVSGKLYIRENAELNLNGGQYQLTVKKNGEVSGNGIINRKSMYCIKSDGKLKIKLNQLETEVIDGVTYIGGILTVNKQIALPSDYNYGVDNAAYSAFLKLKAAAEEQGFDMKLISSFRSYETQKKVFNNWCLIDGEEKASMYSARPGHSEHQTGLAFDVTSLNATYGNTAEGKWLEENCYKYGFIIRYPKNKTDITGYDYEPWHIRYLGKKAAKAVYETGLCLEEFLGIS